jgi:hypothetical protein
LKGYEYVKANPSIPLTQEVVDSFHVELESLNQGQMEKFVQNSINKQVIDMFSKLHERNAQESKRRLELPENPLAQSNRNTIEFQLECKPSIIPNAGNGVFVNFLQQQQPTMVPGTVVALYPGLVHLKEHLKDRSSIQSLLPDPNFMLMARIDQNLVDGRSAAACPSNPYALGHMINHCVNSSTGIAASNRPNVMQIAYDYPEDILHTNSFPHKLRYLIPNAYATPPTILGKLELTTVCMKGMVFIATSPLADGEELLMDYRLNPEANWLPTWYVSYNKADARQRWATNSNSNGGTHL